MAKSLTTKALEYFVANARSDAESELTGQGAVNRLSTH